MVQQTEELTTSALITSSGMPRLEHVLLREGQVGEECDEGIKVCSFLGTWRRIFDRSEDTLKSERRYKAWRESRDCHSHTRGTTYLLPRSRIPV